MDAKKLEASVKKIVQAVLEEHAAAGIESQVEEALKVAESAVSELTEQILSAQQKALDDTTTIENLEQKAADAKSEMAAKTVEFDELNTKNEALIQEAASSKEELDNIKMDMLVKERMTELEGLKISRTGDALEKQTASVRVLTDEEFALYKDEMVSMRDEFLYAAAAETAKATAATEAAAAAAIAAVEANADSVESGDTSDSDSASADDAAGKIVTPPADVEGAREAAAILPPGVDTVDEDRFKNFEVGLSKLLEEGRNRNEDK